jgi:hypothetical protein
MINPFASPKAAVDAEPRPGWIRRLLAIQIHWALAIVIIPFGIAVAYACLVLALWAALYFGGF